ncbi:sororin [Alligator sinensis]|uniref:Sororin n=1 Tax=Alligator sinensis TaxID=38654 RepID=A0A1U7SMJ4_ALLSI|nr:sororin [Alligator sinensis]
MAARRTRSAGAAPGGSAPPAPRCWSERGAGPPPAQRKPLVERKRVGRPVPARMLKRPIVLKKIQPRRQQVAEAAAAPRRSPRISSSSGKENVPAEVSNVVGPSTPAEKPLVEISSSTILSTPAEKPPAHTSPPLDERDTLMAHKVRRSYSRLDATFSPGSGLLDTSTPDRRRSLFGFALLLAPDVSSVPTAAAPVPVAHDSPPDAPSKGQLDTDLPGIALVKEKRKKKKVVQIDVSELDKWAAQMNAQFEEAEKFDLTVE